MQSTFLELLKGVSRSFYLSVRVLPRRMRATVALTYLVARAADTLADAEVLSADDRLNALHLLRRIIEGAGPAEASRLSLMLTQLRTHPHADERTLLEGLIDLLQEFFSLPPEHLRPAKKVLATLTQGMVEDLGTFGTGGSTIRCLEDAQDTERYTYLVAGCVGEFWTELLIVEHLCSWEQARMAQIGVRFGQGLQLVNILRDLPRDLRNGRCYLARLDLERHGMALDDLYRLRDQKDDRIAAKMAPLYAEKCHLARQWLASGMLYIQAIPRYRINLRLAVLWPLLIGLLTLRALEKNPVLLWRTQRPVKIGRSRVYAMMAWTLMLAPLNRLVYGYYRHKGGLAL